VRSRLGTIALTAVAGTGHALYPAAVWAASRRRAAPVGPEPREHPPVSVVVPAYREAAVIAAKVANVLGNGYPAPVEVIVVAEDRRTAEAASGTGAVVLAGVERRGKAASLNRGAKAASHEYVVFTDADTHLLPGALAALLRWFEDPTIGAVAGENTPTARTGEAVYWRFEAWLKQQEFRLGTTIGISGGLFAVRRSIWCPLPEGIIADDFWIALDVTESGKRVAYESTARWLDEADDPSPPLPREWQRRTRIVAGTLDLASRRRHLLVPGSGVAGQLWGHRVVRSSLGPAAHVALLIRAILKAGTSRGSRLFVLVHAAAGGALWRRARGDRLTRPEHLLAHLLLLQAVGLSGTWSYLKRERGGLYPKEDR
jgi:cellulose synthase/poly-beta-1,6-N-acetylglucosamine synthase-like glycosyltransferase